MSAPDSLKIVELVMAIEEALDLDAPLAPTERERLLHELEARIARGEFGDDIDLDDNALGVLVRKLLPHGPHGKSGAVALPLDPA